MTTIDWDALEADDEVAPVPERRLSIGTPPMKTHEQIDWDALEDDDAETSEVQTGASEVQTAESKEDFLTKTQRTMNSAVSGLLQTRTWPLDLANMIVAGSAYSDLDDLLWKLPEDERDEFKQKYLQTINDISQAFPTQSNIERIAEEKTGLPLTPKNQLQKLIKLGGTAFGFAPTGSSIATRVGAGIAAPTTSKIAQETGVPEGTADLLGLGVGALFRNDPLSIFRGRAPNLTQRLTGPGQNTPPGGSPDLPISQFETAESLLNNLKQEGHPRLTVQLPPGASRRPAAENPLSQRNVSSGGAASPIRPVAHTPLELQDQVTNIFSPNKYRNAAEGGVANVQEIRNLDAEVYRGVGELYERSRQLNEGIETIHPQLDSYLDGVIRNIERIPEPSAVQNRMLTAAKNIRNRLSQRTDGVVTGYTAINNQALIDQVQSLRSIIDYDFQHGGAKNIFRPMIAEIQDSIINGARQSGNLEAVAANIEARTAYRDWANTFDNDYIRPFRDTSNHDFIKLFERTKNPDNFNQISHVLELSPRGQQLGRANLAHIVEDKMSKFIKNPGKINVRELDQSLRDLESIAGVTPDQIMQVRNSILDSARAPNFRASPRQTTDAQRRLGRYANEKPEYIQNMLNNRSGIRQLREDSQRTIEGRRDFDIVTRQEMRNILHENKVHKNFKGRDIENVLNNTKNYEIFSEIIGEEATAEALAEAQKLGNRQMKLDTIKELGKKAGLVKFLHTIGPLVG